jgi:hypothetical protein
MFETNLDILYFVLSIAIGIIALFLTWLLYQAARFIKNANDIVEIITEKLELINEAVQFMQKRVDKVSRHMNSVTGILTTLVENFVIKKMNNKLEDTLEKRKKKTTRKRNSAKK